MTRRIATFAAAALTTLAVVGCDSHAYDPKMSNSELTAYAGQNKYPMNMTAEQSDNLVYSVADNGTISLENLGDRTLADFQVWVNKSYVLEVSSLPAHNYKNFSADKFFNSAGQSLNNEPGKENWTVQVRESGQLMTARKGSMKM